TVTQWHEVADTNWQIPAAIWEAAPEGELFWTVRVVETSGETRQPALMRRIHRAAGGALGPVIATDAIARMSGAMLSCQGLRTAGPGDQAVPQAAGQTILQMSRVIYRVTITRDVEGRLILRRFLTDKPQLDLRSIQSMLGAGESYYWRVEAFSNSGRFIMAG